MLVGCVGCGVWGVVYEVVGVVEWVVQPLDMQLGCWGCALAGAALFSHPTGVAQRVYGR